MNKTRIILSVVLFFAIYASLVFAFPVHADSLILPQPLTHAGLTFEQPLTFANSQKMSIQPLTIQFQSTQTIEISKPTKPEVLAESIVSPTPKKEVLSASTIRIPQVYADEITPTPTPSPTPQPTPTVPDSFSNPGGLNADKLFSMVNSYRESKGLPDFQKDDKTCQLAQSRAPEINNEIASGTMHSGLRARNLPYWNTENIISMNSDEAAFNWWINDSIHLQAILSNKKYSCIACSGDACAEEFTSYQPK